MEKNLNHKIYCTQLYLKNNKMVFMILNGSAILMTNLFLLAVQLILELILSVIQKLLKWVFQEHCQICIVKN